MSKLNDDYGIIGHTKESGLKGCAGVLVVVKDISEGTRKEVYDTRAATCLVIW